MQDKYRGGDGKFNLSIIGDVFEGLNAVKRQKMIYKILNAQIQSGLFMPSRCSYRRSLKVVLDFVIHSLKIMDRLIINGGISLEGEIRIAGPKTLPCR